MKLSKTLARVFTGLGLSYRSDTDGTNVRENGYFDRGNCGPANSAHYCWTQPMKFFPSHHDFGEKKLFTDNGEQLVISASSGADLSEAVKRVRCGFRWSDRS